MAELKEIEKEYLEAVCRRLDELRRDRPEEPPANMRPFRGRRNYSRSQHTEFENEKLARDEQLVPNNKGMLLKRHLDDRDRMRYQRAQNTLVRDGLLVLFGEYSRTTHLALTEKGCKAINVDPADYAWWPKEEVNA